MNRRLAASAALLLAVWLLVTSWLFAQESRATLLSTGATAALAGLATFAIVIFAAPIVFRRAIAARPLPESDLRRRLVRDAELARVNVEILVGNTGNASANAIACGATRRSRCIVLTDRLLERFTPDEIESLFMHELAHFQRSHLPLRIAVVVVPVACVFALAAIWPALLSSLQSWLALTGVSEQSRQAVLYPAATAVYGYLALGWTARRCEYDADAWACRIAAPDAAAARQTRIETMTRTILKLTLENGADPHRATWLHPSAFDRANRLAALHRELAAAPPTAFRGHGKDKPAEI